MAQIDPIIKLTSSLAKLPGVGQKTAQRLSYHILAMDEEDVRELSANILDAKINTHTCALCGNYTDGEHCYVCADESRDSKTICVVRGPREVAALERTREYRGLYHVLHGAISPIDGIGPEDIRVKELLSRLADIDEIILATNPDIEGEATAAYIARLIKPMGIKVTRIAHGMPVGSELEYTDEITIARAMQGRHEM